MSASPSTQFIRQAARARVTAAVLAATPQAPPMFQTIPNATKAPQRIPSAASLPHHPSTPAYARQTLPNSSNAPHPHPISKTNPAPTPSSIRHPPSSLSKPPRPLTPDQLRAARLLVAGHSTNDIAAALNIERHTLSRWKRRPNFQHEIRRLIDEVPR